MLNEITGAMVHESADERAKPGFMRHLVEVNASLEDDELWAPEPFKPDLFGEPGSEVDLDAQE